MIIYLVLGSKSRVGWCSKAATTGIAFVSRPYSTPILSALTYHTDLFKWSQFYLLIQSNHPRISLSSHLRDRDLCHDEEITLRDPTNLPMNGGESGDVTLALSVACTFPPFSIRKGLCRTGNLISTNLPWGNGVINNTLHVTRSAVSQRVDARPAPALLKDIYRAKSSLKLAKVCTGQLPIVLLQLMQLPWIA
jgi:hypothetical protein